MTAAIVILAPFTVAGIVWAIGATERQLYRIGQWRRDRIRRRRAYRLELPRDRVWRAK